ncbi:hypothetical protein MMC17_001927 [Xylographa soralifera]|nr:hypothetical protein [Xylographa soralifera]
MTLAMDGYSFAVIENAKHLLDVPLKAQQHPHGITNGSLKDSRFFLADSPQPEPSAAIKHIMVTGGNGFIGYWLLHTLANLYAGYYHFVSYDSVGYGMSTQNTECLKQLANFSFFEGDITSFKDVENCLEEYQIDTIIHLAAQSHVTDSSNDPLGSANVNINGTLILLNAAKSWGVRRFIFMSSGTVYGAAKQSPTGFAENCHLAPVNSYAASKAAAEMLVMAVGYQSKMKTMIVRACNVYGPNQFPEKVIPKFILLLKRGMKLPLNGTEIHSRHYMYIGDVVNAFNAILHKGRSEEVYNLGSDEETCNRDLCIHLLNCIRPSGDDGADVDAWIEPAAPKPLGDRGAMMDCSKLKSLGWNPLVDMGQGIRKTVDWQETHKCAWPQSKCFTPSPPLLTASAEVYVLPLRTTLLRDTADLLPSLLHLSFDSLTPKAAPPRPRPTMGSSTITLICTLTAQAGKLQRVRIPLTHRPLPPPQPDPPRLQLIEVLTALATSAHTHEAGNLKYVVWAQAEADGNGGKGCVVLFEE